MRLHFRDSRFAALALIACGSIPAYAQKAAQEPNASPVFTRLVHTDKTSVALETRSVKLVPSNGHGPVIWLVSTAHIGQADYYKSIQKLLDEQSLVLFEGVKKDAAPPSKDAPAPNAPKSKEAFPNKGSSTYQLFADAVGLDFQLNDIDYTRKTFKNCDLTWDQVAALSAQQGKQTQGAVTNIGQLLDSTSTQGQMFAQVLTQIKADPGSRVAMRVVLAEALSKPGILDKFLGEATSEVLIKNRNAKVLKTLDEESSNPSIAIFFGAAHMPDMEQRIIADRHYREAQEVWMPAITADESKVTGMGVQILQAFRGLLGTAKK